MSDLNEQRVLNIDRNTERQRSEIILQRDKQLRKQYAMRAPFARCYVMRACEDLNGGLVFRMLSIALICKIEP